MEQKNFRKTSISYSRPEKRLKVESGKGRPKSSFVWEYFVIENNAHYCQVAVPISNKYPESKCKHRYHASNNTSNMIKHLANAHGINNNRIEITKVSILYISMH